MKIWENVLPKCHILHGVIFKMIELFAVITVRSSDLKCCVDNICGSGAVKTRVRHCVSSGCFVLSTKTGGNPKQSTLKVALFVK
jgi:hypothetical protein